MIGCLKGREEGGKNILLEREGGGCEGREVKGEGKGRG